MKLSPELYLVAYFLSRCGSSSAEGRPAKPPAQLAVRTWRQAFELFRASLGQGRSAAEFRNSLKNARDLFDGHNQASGRSGWREKEAGPASQRHPRELTADARQVLLAWETQSDEQLWSEVQTYLIFSASQEPGSSANTDKGFLEGRELLCLHRRKERNRKAVISKKKHVLAKKGKLLCEVCDFDFADTYGQLGAGFAECHHRVPLGQLRKEQRIRLTDLAIVCANCHRMLHRPSWHSVESLRQLVQSRRSSGEQGRNAGQEAFPSE